MAPKNPTTVTIYGRLSFPIFSYNEAVANNAKSPTPNPDPTKVTPEYHLVVEQAQLDKFLTHVKDVFLPYCLEQGTKGEKKNARTEAEVKRLLKAVDSDWTEQPPYIPLKPVSEKTLALAPTAVAMIKVKGNRGVDVEQKAIVNSEDELIVPDPDILSFPVVKPINQTVHSMYPGAQVAATLNLYSYLSGKVPGFSASAGVAVFKGDDERFGGGVTIDEDEIFAD